MTVSHVDCSARIRLRDPLSSDLEWMAEVACDPELVGPHNWGGEPRDRADVESDLQTRFDTDGLVGIGSGTLIVELDEGMRIGDVSWRTERSTRGAPHVADVVSSKKPLTRAGALVNWNFLVSKMGLELRYLEFSSSINKRRLAWSRAVFDERPCRPMSSDSR
jgi:hypothetical protein